MFARYSMLVTGFWIASTLSQAALLWRYHQRGLYDRFPWFGRTLLAVIAADLATWGVLWYTGMRRNTLAYFCVWLVSHLVINFCRIVAIGEAVDAANGKDRRRPVGASALGAVISLASPLPFHRWNIVYGVASGIQAVCLVGSLWLASLFTHARKAEKPMDPAVARHIALFTVMLFAGVIDRVLGLLSMDAGNCAGYGLIIVLCANWVWKLRRPAT